MSHSRKEMISFFVTTKCNLDCIYCYTNKKEGTHKGQVLNIDFAKAGIDDYFNKTPFKKHIRFQGAGEPTMEISLIKEILKYAKEKGGDDVTAELQTNCCFSEEIAEWVADNIDNIWASCDGLPQIQNHNRPFLSGIGSSAIFERNIRFLVSRAKKMIGIRSTITKQNIHLQKECIDYYNSLGIKYIWVDPIFPVVGEKEVEDGLDMMDFAKAFLEACVYAHNLGIEYGSILTCNFDEKCTYACRACLPVPHLTTDGYISGCDMALYGEDKNSMSLFYYGKWDSNTKEIIYDKEKIAYIKSRTADNMPKCKNCVAKYHCCGYCPGEVLNETNDYFGQKTKVCPAIRWLYINMPLELKKYTYTHP